MSANSPAIVDQKAVTLPDDVVVSSPFDSEKQLSDQGSLKEAYGSLNESEIELQKRWYEPPDSYESKHRWDPRATWTAEEETKLRRRLDLRVTFVACLCFFCLQLDRGNITNALSDNMLKDIGLTTADYNVGMTIFYACFLGAELPSQMISKRLGSDVWIPIQMMAWSAVALSQMAINGKASFFATRALIGVMEGGFIADTILYLSYYYTATELTIRLSWFWVTLTFTNIVGSLAAAGFLKMRGVHGLAGWRWLFCIEGALTFSIGLFAFFYLPASPTQTITRFRKTPWFTPREETIIVNKVLRDDPTKSSMHNRQGLSLRDMWDSITDFDLWPIYILGLLTFIAPGTINAYFTLTLKSLGYTTFQTNLLTIPSYVLYIINNLALAFTSKRFRERFLVSSLSAWWLLIFLIVIVAIPDDTNKWARWTILTLLLAYPYSHPILVSTTSMNAGSVRTRTVASATYNMFVQAGSLVASNIYQPSDKPYYHKGNRALIGIVVANIVVFFLAKAWFVYRNKQKAKIWNSWSFEQRDEYIKTTKDKGNKRLDFVFQH